MTRTIFRQFNLSLKRSNLIILLGFLLISCVFNGKNIPRSQIASEIICPDGKKYLIRYAYAREVFNAIRKDYVRKLRERSSESYTAMKIPGMESFLIEQNPSEKLISCQVSQGLLRNIQPRYVRYFDNRPSSQFELRTR